MSALIAPTRMVSQITCLVAAVSDTSMDWAAARRDEQKWTLASALRAQGLETIIGLSMAATLFRLGHGIALWLSPVWFGLVFAIPIDAFLSSRRVGRAFRALGLFVTPAETDPPEVIRRALELEREHAAVPSSFAERFDALVADPWLNALHVGLQRSAGSRELSAAVVEPMVERLLSAGIDSLSKREAMVVLSDSKVMERLHRQRFRALVHRADYGTFARPFGRAGEGSFATPPV
jgi:membrane glycosyltransferase